MPTMLDERPAPKSPILFGRALVARQNAEAEAQKSAEQSRQFAEREARMRQQHADQMALQQQALALREAATSLQLQKEKMLLEAADMRLKEHQYALHDFQNATREIGKLDPKADNYDESLAEIKAKNYFAFTQDATFSGALDDLIQSKTKARDMWMKSNEEIASAQRKRTLEAADMDTAFKVGMMPQSATIGGFTFKNQEKPETFESFQKAQEKYPNARLSGTVDESGAFTVKSIGTKSAGAEYGAEELGGTPAIPGTSGAPEAATERKPLSDIFGAKK